MVSRRELSERQAVGKVEDEKVDRAVCHGAFPQFGLVK
jgi:hypothetical protein